MAYDQVQNTKSAGILDGDGGYLSDQHVGIMPCVSFGRTIYKVFASLSERGFFNVTGN